MSFISPCTEALRETVLGDEDQEQNLDRWVSHTPSGQEFWQILSQWLWNLRLELGGRLNPVPMRLTELAPAQQVLSTPTLPLAASVSSASGVPPTQAVSSGPPQFARPSDMGGFAGSAFVPQPDGTLRCPAHQPLYPNERRLERNGSLRIVYAARLGHCRSCSLREQCQGTNHHTVRARRVSAVCLPLSSPPAASREPAPTGEETGAGALEPPEVTPESSSALLEPAPTVSVPEEVPSARFEPAPTGEETRAGALEPPQVTLESSSPPLELAPTGGKAEGTDTTAALAPEEAPFPSLEPAAPTEEARAIAEEPASPLTPCPVLWEDWPRSLIRRKWLQLLRTETVLLTKGAVETPKQTGATEPSVLTRAQRAHWRLSWSQRLARNARRPLGPPLSITLHGLPVSFAAAFGIAVAAAA